MAVAPQLTKLNPATHNKVNSLFLDMALAYELGGDWKRVAKRRANCSTGVLKKFCLLWLDKSDAHMEKAVEIFLSSLSDYTFGNTQESVTNTI